MTRLFVAAWPPPAVLDLLDAWPRPERPGVRWTTRAQWHVTLRFLGDADPAAVQAALERVWLPAAEARLGPRAEPLGRGVLMLPVAGLDPLAAAVDAAVGDLGAPRAEGAFVGHLTLARLRRGSVAGLTGGHLTARWPVTAVALVASERHPNGARYVTRASFAVAESGSAS